MTNQRKRRVGSIADELILKSRESALATWYWYESWLKEVRKHCQENKNLYI